MQARAFSFVVYGTQPPPGHYTIRSSSLSERAIFQREMITSICSIRERVTNARVCAAMRKYFETRRVLCGHDESFNLNIFLRKKIK